MMRLTFPKENIPFTTDQANMELFQLKEIQSHRWVWALVSHNMPASREHENSVRESL